MVALSMSSAPALGVFGRASFSRSGVVTIAKGKQTASVGGVDVSADSLVLATL